MSNVYIGHVGALLLLSPIFVFAIAVKYLLWVRSSYCHRSGLSSVPGPKWAAWTRFWIVKALASGKAAEIFIKVNKDYGTLARIGPNHLLTDDPEVTRRLLAARSGYTRGPWFDSIRIDPHAPNIVSERDERKHGKLKYKLSPSFSNKNIIAMEPLIDDRVRDWIERINRSWLSSDKNSIRFDIGKRIQFLTVDIITKICLGEQLGCVEEDTDKYGFLSTVEQATAIAQHFSVLLELNSLIYYFAKLPLIGSFVVPKTSDRAGVGRIMRIVEEASGHQTFGDSKESVTMLNNLAERGVLQSQINAEVVIALVAGSDTTSTSVQSTLLAIISNPNVYQKLKHEIHDAEVAGKVSYPILNDEANQLPYLQACILEGLRKHPPLTQLRERMVPVEGDEINGHYIPGGTFVGLNTWGTQLNEVYGHDPEVFRPERWLDQDEETLAAMLRTHDLIFGHGTTKCLGTLMARMQLSKMIFELLRNFDITIANPYKPWSSTCYGIFFQKDFNVYLTKACSDNRVD